MNKSTKKAADIAVKVIRAHEFENGNVSFDCVANGITIYGMTYVEAVKGKYDAFISFPRRKGSDEKYYNYVYFPIDDELQADIISQLEKLTD